MKPKIAKVLITCALLLGSFRAMTQTYSLDWFIIDNGSGTSSGDVYSLGIIIGQTYAGPTMSGGGYTMDTGFWTEPTSPAAMRSETLYVANFGDSTIEQFTLDRVGSPFANSGLFNPYGLALDNAGNLYAANYGNNTIEKFTPDGVGSVFANSGLFYPDGLVLDRAGNLYVANQSNNTIEKFTTNGVGSVFASSGLFNPVGLAFDSAGNLYAANYDNNTIRKFTPDGVDSLFASTGLSNPTGLAFDSAGNLYAANFGASTIEKFTTKGVGSVFASSGSSRPWGLAFDSAGNLYAANPGNGTIEKFTTNGIASVFATGLSNPSFIAIGPLSKPSAPRLEISAVVVTGGNTLGLSFGSVAGFRYAVQSRANLEAGDWVTVPGSAVVGTGDVVPVALSKSSSDTRQFYRIVQLP